MEELNFDSQLSLSNRVDVSSSLLGKICIICNCAPASMDPEDCFIYFIDLDACGSGDGGIIPKNPNFCFCRESLGAKAYGLLPLYSKLYLFELKGDTSMRSYRLPPWSSLSLFSFHRLTSSELDGEPPMNYPKFVPTATPTPDGKRLLVFSSLIHIDYEQGFENYNGNFELFDPLTAKWELLPELKQQLPSLCGPFYNDWRICTIQGYSFINSENILLLRTRLGDFSLDLDNTSIGWQKFTKFKRTPITGIRFLLNDDLCLSGSCAYVNYSMGASLYPRIPSLNKNDYFASYSGITDFGGGLFCTALIMMGCSSTALSMMECSSMNAHMFVNVFAHDKNVKEDKGKNNKDDYEEEEDKGNDKGESGEEKPVMNMRSKRIRAKDIEKFVLPGTTLLKSFKFLVRAHSTNEFVSFGAPNIFAFPSRFHSSPSLLDCL